MVIYCRTNLSHAWSTACSHDSRNCKPFTLACGLSKIGTGVLQLDEAKSRKSTDSQDARCEEWVHNYEGVFATRAQTCSYWGRHVIRYPFPYSWHHLESTRCDLPNPLQFTDNIPLDTDTGSLEHHVYCYTRPSSPLAKDCCAEFDSGDYNFAIGPILPLGMPTAHCGCRTAVPMPAIPCQVFLHTACISKWVHL